MNICFLERVSSATNGGSSKCGGNTRPLFHTGKIKIAMYEFSLTFLEQEKPPSNGATTDYFGPATTNRVHGTVPLETIKVHKVHNLQKQIPYLDISGLFLPSIESTAPFPVVENDPR